jgi:hypothetical protein
MAVPTNTRKPKPRATRTEVDFDDLKKKWGAKGVTLASSTGSSKTNPGALAEYDPTRKRIILYTNDIRNYAHYVGQPVKRVIRQTLAHETAHNQQLKGRVQPKTAADWHAKPFRRIINVMGEGKLGTTAPGRKRLPPEMQNARELNRARRAKKQSSA